jgi:hypothetical protein
MEPDIQKNLEEAKKFAKCVRTILGIDTLTTYVMNVSTANFILTRARKNESIAKDHNEICIDDLSYPNPECVNKHGRANIWRESKYYCADIPATALLEVRPRNELVTTIDIKIRKPQLRLLAVHPNSKYQISGTENFTDKEIAFNKFMAQKFVEAIPDDSHQLYLPTAILTKLLLNNFDGIVYPSVASNLSGENFALRTEIINEYAGVVEARIQETYDHISPYNFKVKCLYRANRLNKNGCFDWKNVNCVGHSINQDIHHE